MSWAGVAEELKRFNEALKMATQSAESAAAAQEDLADATEDAAGGGPGVRGSGEGGAPSDTIGAFSSRLNTSPYLWGQALGAAGSFASSAAGVAGNVLGGAAGNFGAGASASDALEASALQQAKEFIQSNPEINLGAFGFDVGGQIPGGALLAATGVSAAFNNAEQAGSRVGGSLAQLAEAGFDISDDDIQRNLDVELERVQRGNAVRARANAQAISVENIGGQLGSDVGREMLRVLERIANNTGAGGGAQ